MKFINYLSTAAIPVVIVIIILYGIIERKKVYDIFFRWCKRWNTDSNSINTYVNRNFLWLLEL